MATQLFLGRIAMTDWNSGNNDSDFIGATLWNALPLRLTRDTGLSTSVGSTVAGPTNGIVVGNIAWISQPLDADVTISGSITWNIWASESDMAANVAINGQLEVIDGATGAFTLIDKTARVTEAAVTTRAVNNFAETPAAGVACKRGDRLRVLVFGDDAGTMANAYSFNVGYGLASAGADGDTYLTLTENLTFVSEPAGTTIYPTDTASDVATASVDREAWTSRGAGVQNDVVNTVSGYTAPIQLTDTAGGTVVDWFTKSLSAFTLGGAARCNIRHNRSSGLARAVCYVEVAVVNADGTGAVVWAINRMSTAGTTTEAAASFLVSGDDVSVTAGQRLRIRLGFDDHAVVGSGPMVVGHTATVFYAGTTGGASGDTFLTFTQTLTENTGGGGAAESFPYIGGGYYP